MNDVKQTFVFSLAGPDGGLYEYKINKKLIN